MRSHSFLLILHFNNLYVSTIPVSQFGGAVFLDDGALAEFVNRSFKANSAGKVSSCNPGYVQIYDILSILF